jgi:hypothetical protein
MLSIGFSISFMPFIQFHSFYSPSHVSGTFREPSSSCILWTRVASVTLNGRYQFGSEGSDEVEGLTSKEEYRIVLRAIQDESRLMNQLVE